MLPQKLAIASATKSDRVRFSFADSSNLWINSTFRRVRSSTDLRFTVFPFLALSFAWCLIPDGTKASKGPIVLALEWTIHEFAESLAEARSRSVGTSVAAFGRESIEVETA